MKFYKTHPNEFDDNKWLNKYISTSYEHKMIKMMEHILYKVCYYSTTKTKKIHFISFSVVERGERFQLNQPLQRQYICMRHHKRHDCRASKTH